MNKNTKKVVLTAGLSMGMCLSLISGATYALFTSESHNDITITAGKVEVTSSISSKYIEAYSNGIEVPVDSATKSGTFANGGTFKIEDNGFITLDRVTPGDKISFKIKSSDKGNVKAKYRLVDSCESGFELYSKLNISYDNNWQDFSKYSSGDRVEIELPFDTGNEYQGLTTKFKLSVEAVQANAAIGNDVMHNDIKFEPVTVTPVENEDVVLKTSNGAAKVLVPSNRATAGSDVTLTIKNIVNDGKFNISDGACGRFYDIDVSGLNADTEDCKVSLFIGKGLSNVKVYHLNETPSKDDDVVEGSVYDAKTGYVTFSTSTFSPFAIESFNSEDIALENPTIDVLNNAVKAAKDNAVITLPKGSFDVNGTLTIENKNITLESIDSTEFNNLTIDIKGTSEVDLNNLVVDGGANSAIITSEGTDLDIHGGEYSADNDVPSAKIGGTGYFVDASFTEFDPSKDKSNFVGKASYVTSKTNRSGITTYTIHKNDEFEARILEVSKTESKILYLNEDMRLSPYNSSIFPAFELLDGMTLDLNGHRIDVIDNGAPTGYKFSIFKIDDSNKVTVIDSSDEQTGTIDASCGDNTCWTFMTKDKNAVLDIKSGNFVGSPNVVLNDGGTINVHGGKFETSKDLVYKPNEKNEFLLNCQDSEYQGKRAFINVFGGSFVGWNPADHASEGVHTNFVAEGYEAKELNGVWTVSKKAEEPAPETPTTPEVKA